MRAAVIAKRMTIEAVIEYLETVERFAEIKRIREEARAEALHKIEEQKTQSKHERDVAAEKRKEELAEAKHRAVTAESAA